MHASKPQRRGQHLYEIRLGMNNNLHSIQQQIDFFVKDNSLTSLNINVMIYYVK